MSERTFEVAIDGERATLTGEMLSRFIKPGPRYTSYPTAPQWDESFGAEEHRAQLMAPSSRPISLYFHLPFCSSLCLFCGCNVVISRDRKIAIRYLDQLKLEIDRVSALLGSDRLVEQLHWGGGTPTYLSTEQIEDLYSHIRSRFTLAPDAEIGVEIEPRVTTPEQCILLRELGFNRLSMGVQDFDPIVQQTIRRIQPYEMTREIFDRCRSLGFESINIDLIYGLPHQTIGSFRDTVDRVIGINPDRIALFSYAHVPWMKKQQGSFVRYLPQSEEKFAIFAMAIERLVDAGYRYIGMDHFVRPDDELSRAQDARTLQRNFQGYTTKAGCDLVGMGLSAISTFDGAYAQNWRALPFYYDALELGEIPTMRGIILSDEDRLRRSVINRVLCHCVVVKSEVEQEFGIGFDEHFGRELDALKELEEDRMVRLGSDRIAATPLGRIFIRNIAMVFDAYLATESIPLERRFSSTL